MVNLSLSFIVEVNRNVFINSGRHIIGAYTRGTSTELYKFVMDVLVDNYKLPRKVYWQC